MANQPAPISRPVRYGIIGSGMMGGEHILDLVSNPDAEVVALSDPVPSSLEWGVACAGRAVDTYADHRQLLARDDLDAVVIASPNFTHASLLGDVLETDLAVMVEKPMCTTVQDCVEVKRRAEGRSAMTWVGLEYRYIPVVSALLQQLSTGVCGTTRMVSIREHRFPFLVKVGNWNRFSENTGGTLVEKCCHFFDLMRLVAGADPTQVFASGSQDVNHLDEVYEGRVPDILDNAFVIVDFANGGWTCRCLPRAAGSSRRSLSLAIWPSSRPPSPVTRCSLVAATCRAYPALRRPRQPRCRTPNSTVVRRISSTCVSSTACVAAGPPR